MIVKVGFLHLIHLTSEFHEVADIDMYRHNHSWLIYVAPISIEAIGLHLDARGAKFVSTCSDRLIPNFSF